MSNINIINDDILNAKDDYIAHQCNCITSNAKGLAKTLFKRFPYANDYSNRIIPDQPGTIKIHGDGINNRYIINMFAQYLPGSSGREPRLEWFEECLGKIEKLCTERCIIHDHSNDNKLCENKKVTLGLPYNIGCGLGGGNWNDYYNVIENFSKKNPNIKINLYKL